MQSWQLQEAKARFSELVKQAASDGPQEITVHGRSVAIVLSREEFDRLAGGRSLVDFMRRSPLREIEEIDFPRDKSPTRPTPL
ncbi:MAG: type II toxin-antitoxin system Phd/YefM family antitoxin [Burkholderiaceae bacterium]|nr:type II toxin-antitoxin system Phd/YefM family antitoxin [Burkholderiaceae bacterium]